MQPLRKCFTNSTIIKQKLISDDIKFAESLQDIEEKKIISKFIVKLQRSQISIRRH